MGAKLDALNPKLVEFIEAQQLFFVATAGTDGHVNMSPKGLDSLRVQDHNTLLWLNLTGSGNETAAHLLEQNRMTVMFCSFDELPLILRCYGTAKTYHPRDDEWEQLSSHFPDYPSARQIFKVHIDLVQTSCGYGLPKMDFVSERSNFDDWVEKKGGKPGVEKYWKEKNSVSLNGKPTGI